MKIKCVKRDSTCPYLTDNKVYDAKRVDHNDRTVEFRDDVGILRATVPDGLPSAHMVVVDEWGKLDSTRSGHFVEVRN